MLYSLSARHYRVDPTETLAKIGIPYFLVFLILQLQFRWQVVARVALMVLNWGMFAPFPGPTGPFDAADDIGFRIDRLGCSASITSTTGRASSSWVAP